MGGSSLVGLLACAYSSFGFGSQYVWARNHDRGDGVFIHWVLCTTVAVIGIAADFYNGFPQFQPLAMLGGFAFAAGNIAAVPLLNILGMGMATLLSCTVNCLVGWAVGNFGFFGVLRKPDTSNTNMLLNYLGVIGVVAGGIFFSMVKTTDKPSPSSKRENEEEPLQSSYRGVYRSMTAGSPNSNSSAIRIIVNSGAYERQENEESNNGPSTAAGEENVGQPHHRQTAIQQRSSSATPSPQHSQSGSSGKQEKHSEGFDKRKIIAVVGCVLAGICYGVNFIPVLYIQENPHQFVRPPTDGIAFSHSHFTGIFLASTLFFAIYCIYHKNRPFINPRLVLPSMMAGLLWGTAQLGWFIANDRLSQAISFPIIGTMPGVCAAMWSVFCFKEIQGRRNLTLLAVAIALTCGGAALVGMSKG